MISAYSAMLQYGLARLSNDQVVCVCVSADISLPVGCWAPLLTWRSSFTSYSVTVRLISCLYGLCCRYCPVLHFQPSCWCSSSQLPNSCSSASSAVTLTTVLYLLTPATSVGNKSTGGVWASRTPTSTINLVFRSSSLKGLRAESWPECVSQPC